MGRVTFFFFSGLAWLGFLLVRFWERVLPQNLLSLLLLPFAALWGMTRVGQQRKAIALWSRVPQSWPGRNRISFIRWQTLGAHHARCVYFWPDRLSEARWQRRCRLEGNAPPVGASQRRVVFASLHFGPFETLPYWLRAHGLIVTVLVGRAAPRQRLKQRQYALSPPSDVPVVLPVNEKNLREAVGRAENLLVFVDVNRGRQIEVPFGDENFRMASGAIRLAAMTGADLVPCLIAVTGQWRFTIHFGDAVPRCHLGAMPNLEAAASHLLEEFQPVLRRQSAQSGFRLLSCLSPLGPAQESHGQS